MILYWLTRFFFRAFAKICFRLKVEGEQNLPKQAGFVLAANHASSLDPFVIASAIPRYIRWLVIYEYYDLWYFKWMLKSMCFIRIKNNLPKGAFRALLQGEIVGLFPEARRTWSGNLGQGRAGAATLASRTSCPVVPVAILGTFQVLPRTRKSLKLHPITVRIGKPLFFSELANRKDALRTDLENTQKIMRSIAELLY